MMPKQENQIAERSYHIWEREGRPDGRDQQHWFQALAELQAESASPEAPSSRRAAAATSRKPASSRKRRPTTGNA